MCCVISIHNNVLISRIIDVTEVGSYHGFLPMMVRSCISALTSPTGKSAFAEQFPLPLATALFSFVYHLASYELGGEALVNCGMLESLIKVINWTTTDPEQITVRNYFADIMGKNTIKRSTVYTCCFLLCKL